MDRENCPLTAHTGYLFESRLSRSRRGLVERTIETNSPEQNKAQASAVDSRCNIITT